MVTWVLAAVVFIPTAGLAFHRLQGSFTGPVVDRLVGDDSRVGDARTYNRQGRMR